MGRKFKFQVQDSDFEYLFWRFDKQIALSEKNLPLLLYILWLNHVLYDKSSG